MAEDKPFIDPARLGLWVVVAVVLGILDLGVGLVALTRIGDATTMTQTEILVLQKKIDEMRTTGAAAPAK